MSARIPWKRALLAVLATILLVPVLAFYMPFNFRELPELKQGDLIFESFPGPDAMGVNFGTLSLYSHMGIIDVRDKKISVLDSSGNVRRWPLDEWISHSINGRFAVYRDERMNESTAHEFLLSARPYMGAKYDYFFLFGNDELYCSELPYLMYKQIGLKIGKVETIGDLWLLNPFSYELIKSRWIYHPQCQALQMSFDQCYKILREQRLITPASISRDAHLTKIYSNYYGGLF